ncbi:MAG: putative Succinyl-CoA ligase [ADP-forming] subunit alpha [Promethearchaeota archaeon]|jgi:acetyltransferase|nr:MAG: putative Succinyl-CoA ligase [ADP-forming] subunit alpha [Candidatus Lokiarchaeota archaeon]
MSKFERLFNPKAVGIIGVNEKPYGGGYFLNCLESIGFERPIYLFNPRLKGKTIFDHRVYGSILEVEENETIDYVIIAVPAEKCPKILQEVGEKRVPYATIFSSGFSEVGKKTLENQVLSIAEKYNVRIIGPNCLGVYNPKARLSVSRWQTAYPGSFGLISQSGGLSINITNTAIHSYSTYISKAISIGNQIDLNVIDFLEYFNEDTQTKIIGLYLENLKVKNSREGKKFIELLKQICLSGKPIILWKVGYGESAKEAILSHTGGMAGSHKLWKDMAKQTGTLLVNNTLELVSLAMAFKYIDYKKIERDKLGIIAVGGGTSIELTEQMELNGLMIPTLSNYTKEQYQQFLPAVNTIFTNPLDLGGNGLMPNVFAKSLITLDTDPNISCVIFIKPYYLTKPFSDAIIQAKNQMKKPLICITPKIRDNLEDFRERIAFKKALFAAGIPVFESVDLASKALRKLCEYKEFLDHYNHHRH